MEDLAFEWNEAKRASNLAKHGFDFVRALRLFAGPHSVGPGQTVRGETRELATGWLNDCWITIVFTRRAAAIRIISVRSARRGEKVRYQALFGD